MLVYCSVIDQKKVIDQIRFFHTQCFGIVENVADRLCIRFVEGNRFGTFVISARPGSGFRFKFRIFKSRGFLHRGSVWVSVLGVRKQTTGMLWIRITCKTRPFYEYCVKEGNYF